MQHKTITKYAASGSILLLFLAGCSDGADDVEGKQNAFTSMFSTQVEALNKANGVESTIQDSFNKRDQLMDAQGQ